MEELRPGTFPIFFFFRATVGNMEHLPNGATIKPAKGGPGEHDQVYEWTADPDRTYKALPAEEVHRRSEHVSAVYRK